MKKLDRHYGKLDKKRDKERKQTSNAKKVKDWFDSLEKDEEFADILDKILVRDEIK